MRGVDASPFRLFSSTATLGVLWLSACLGVSVAACGDDNVGVDPDAATLRDADTPAWAPPAHCTDGPLSEPMVDCTPPPAPSSGDLAQDCVDRINQLRAECQCLPPLARWRDGEACATEQAAYDRTRRPHAGFQDGICNAGSAQNECPGWRDATDVVRGCLQAMWDEGPGEDFQEHGHYLNMTNSRFTEVACGFDIDSDVWSVQNFR